MLDLDIEMRKGHMERVSKGNCCVNIADAALGKVDMTYFMHICENGGEQTQQQ